MHPCSVEDDGFMNRATLVEKEMQWSLSPREWVAIPKEDASHIERNRDERQ